MGATPPKGTWFPEPPNPKVLRMLLHDGDSEMFEHMVLALVKERWDDAAVVGGARDHGVDIFADRGRIAFQCKQYDEPHWVNFEKSLDDAVEHYEEMKRYVFVAPFRLRAAEYTTFVERLVDRHAGIDVRLWDGAELRNQLCVNPQYLRVIGAEFSAGPAPAEPPPTLSPWFSGRTTLLEDLHASFDGSGNVRILHGIQGSGKSQVAVGYIDRFGSDYEHIWWVNASSEESVLVGLESIAADLGIRSTLQPGIPLLTHVVAQLADASARWLLVLDDASPPAVTELLGALPPGRIIITTLDPDWRGVGLESERLQDLDVDEAVDVLVRRSGRDDALGVRALVEELGRLPLALEQVGAYLEEQPGLSASRYLELFRERGELLFAEGRLLHYSNKLAVVWSLSRERAAEIEPSSEHLLRLLSHVHHRHFPVGLFQDDPLAHDPPWDEVALRRAVAALRRFSLLESVEAASQAAVISMHRLVQTVVRRQLPPEDRDEIALSVALLLEKAVPDRPGRVEDQRAMTPLAHHMLAAAEHAAVVSPIGADLSAQLYGSVGNFERSRGHLVEALSLFSASVSLTERCADLGATDVVRQYTKRLNNLAAVTNEVGNLERVLQLQRRSLELRRSVYEPESREVILAASNLAGTLSDLGRFDEALVLAKEAWRVRSTFDINDPQRAWGAYVMAEILHGCDRPGEALDFATEAVVGLGGPNADVADGAWALEMRAGVLLALDDVEDARRDADAAVSIRQRAGEKHIDNARGWSISGQVAIAEGNVVRAISELKRAQRLRRGQMNDQHPDVLADATRLRALGA